MTRERHIQAVLLSQRPVPTPMAVLHSWLISGKSDGPNVSVRDSARAPALLSTQYTHATGRSKRKLTPPTPYHGR